MNEIVIIWNAREAAFIAQRIGGTGRISRGATYGEALAKAFACLRISAKAA